MLQAIISALAPYLMCDPRKLDTICVEINKTLVHVSQEQVG